MDKRYLSEQAKRHDYGFNCFGTFSQLMGMGMGKSKDFRFYFIEFRKL